MSEADVFKIRLQNKISEAGLSQFPPERYRLSEDEPDPDAIVVRSASLLQAEFGENLKAIARAGTGVNNIPVTACTERGIAVFNTPGANANGVKELVIAAMLLSARRIYQGIGWTQSLAGLDEGIPKAVEKGKAAFAGPEIRGKRLGVIGLGAVGVMVANDASALGMDVIGYDKYLTLSSAWGLSRAVGRAASLEQLLATSDYITIHVPLNDSTRLMLGERAFDLMKPGTRLINLARGELVDHQALLAAIDSGRLACYVTDFPSADTLGLDKVITLPHLGASTPESEDNCAVMAVRQVRDFLEQGIVTNSVNFPDCGFVTTQDIRIIVAHLNVPNMIGQITTTLAASKLNITELLNQHREGLGYTIIDVEGDFDPWVVEDVRAIEGVKMARVVAS